MNCELKRSRGQHIFYAPKLAENYGLAHLPRVLVREIKRGFPQLGLVQIIHAILKVAKKQAPAGDARWRRETGADVQ